MNRQMACFPSLNDLVPFRRRIWELFLLAVIMESGIVGCEKGILDLNLGGKKVRKDGEGSRQKAREVRSQMVIGIIVLLSKVRLCS